MGTARAESWPGRTTIWVLFTLSAAALGLTVVLAWAILAHPIAVVEALETVVGRR